MVTTMRSSSSLVEMETRDLLSEYGFPETTCPSSVWFRPRCPQRRGEVDNSIVELMHTVDSYIPDAAA